MSTPTTREQVLHELQGIRRAVRQGVYAPHKPLMLLLALAHLQRGEPRLQAFSAYDAELKLLLAQFGSTKAAASRHYPFWHLCTDASGQLWTVEGPDWLVRRSPGATPNLGELRSDGVSAGFSQAMYDALRRDPLLLIEAAHWLLEMTFPESLHMDIVQAVGLDLSGAHRLSESAPLAYGTSLSQRRRRDAGFRDAVLRAYDYRCCVCGFDLRVAHIPIGLEAAHIQWHTADGPDIVSNGLSLCATHHKMFDMGAFTVEPYSWRVVFSQHAIGQDQVQFHGRGMQAPQAKSLAPADQYLNWNLKNIFKAPPRQV